MQHMGTIVGERGLPVAGGYFGAMAASGEILFGPTDAEGGVFELSAQLPTDLIFFGAPGYADTVITSNDLVRMLGPGNGVVQLKKAGAENTGLLLGVVAVAAYMYMNNGKKIGGLNEKDIYPIFLLVGGIVGFSVIKSILEKLGIWKSNDSRDLDAAVTDPNSFWNPNFWMKTQHYSYVITEEQAAAYAKEVYDSFGPFNDCEECVIGIFHTLRTKANISFLSYMFNKVYGQDLLMFLRGGIWPQDRLSDADVAEINRFASQLPDF